MNNDPRSNDSAGPSASPQGLDVASFQAVGAHPAPPTTVGDSRETAHPRSAAAARLDKAQALGALEALKGLPPDWNGYGAIPIDRGVIGAAEDFIRSLPGDIATTPTVVPMTRGRLQFEWHRGNRSLELEFESSDRLHYLKWDSDAGVEQEEILSAGDTGAVLALLRWFASESGNA
jgi:hypothetical protein